MAIIVDPDNLDRQQIIFGTINQKISMRDVGSLVHSSFEDADDGVTTESSRTFTSAGSEFESNGVQAGDILCLFTGSDAGHYVIETVNNETTLTLAADLDFTEFSGSTDIIFDIREPSGGSIEDGVTLQTVYSFAKEEWRTDGRTTELSDDLIKHSFPFEAVTREQMEIGGGIAHADWVWFNEYTRKKVRTGGWASRNEANATLEEWSGIITLGSLDNDAQVYYQQVDVSESPVNFTFQGAVNEPIKVNEFGGDDNRNFLKLFVRKKSRTYAQSQISDIGVSQLETIVNRFPLAHAFDAAIDTSDGEILGNVPYRQQLELSGASDEQNLQRKIPLLLQVLPSKQME